MTSLMMYVECWAAERDVCLQTGLVLVLSDLLQDPQFLSLPPPQAPNPPRDGG